MAAAVWTVCLPLDTSAASNAALWCRAPQPQTVDTSQDFSTQTTPAARFKLTTPQTPAQATPAASTPTGPIQIEADTIQSRLGNELRAKGSVHLQRGVLHLSADQVEYRRETDRAKATGNVILQRGTDVFSGPEADLHTTRLDGYFKSPTYRFGRTDAGGQAERVDFLGPQKMVVNRATYSSCEPAAEGEVLPWVLSGRRVHLDFDQNEGLAEGAVLRFYDVPILSLPVLSFPITGERKSGWLPPQFTTSSALGLEIGAPYYWNIAPNLDVTTAPTVSSKRGLGLDSEVRYLEPHLSGIAQLYYLPYDRQAETERWAWKWWHQGTVGRDVSYQIRSARVSDNDYWKSDLRGLDFLTPRLLPTRAQAQQRRDLKAGGLRFEQTLYAQAQSWQVLQDTTGTDAARITAPYQRQPQVGGRWRSLAGPFDWQLQTEANHFTHTDSSLLQGSRAHMAGSLAWPLNLSGWHLTPRLAFNGVTYQTDRAMTDGRSSASRFTPTFTLDSRWTFERDVNLFQRDLTQTLEPRIRYVKTPYRNQAALPNFDSAGLDFNFESAFADNAFSGVDRVSDAHQITAGTATRFLSRQTGAELARLAVAQRYLFSEQQITPDNSVQSKRMSDVLLQASTSALKSWYLDETLQYDTDKGEVVRAVTRARYTPGPYRTLTATYRMQQGKSEQLSLGWQWPFTGWATRASWAPSADTPAAQAVQQSQDAPKLDLDRAPRGGSDCKGSLYGVGWFDYSLRDRRMTAATAGLEYDAGCWIGRLVAQRKSTTDSTSTTKIMLQIEFIGLSRLSLGANPVTAFRDNIPGYRMLRDPNDFNVTSGRYLAPSPISSGVNLFP